MNALEAVQREGYYWYFVDGKNPTIVQGDTISFCYIGNPMPFDSDEMPGQFIGPLEYPPAQRRLDRQSDVHTWCRNAFGDDHAKSVEQRGVRLAEEAIEAAQAAGCKAEMLHRLIDHVYSKPVGDLSQEIGGVGVTLLALAQAATVDADAAEECEFRRVLSKPLEHFAARNAAKNAAGFDVLQENKP